MTLMMPPIDLAEMNAIDWFHRIPLGSDTTTPGKDASAEKLATIALPEDLTGQSVLDIGAWDGFFSFEAERRGAARVVAADHYVWSAPAISKAGFDFAHRTLDSRVEAVDIDVMDLSPQALGTFDLVLFLGVLYHQSDPMAVLHRVASVTTDRLIIETHTDLLDIDRPAIAFYPRDELARDKTNWCGPNKAALKAMLETAGFPHTQVVSESPAPYSNIGATPGTYGRIVMHAWR